jgi:hypothetical protein
MPALCVGPGERDADRVLDAVPVPADFILGFVFQDELAKQVLPRQGADGGFVGNDCHGVEGAVRKQEGRDGVAGFAIRGWVRLGHLVLS